MDLAIKSGAVPESIEVHIEIDPQTQKVTAIALGSTEVKTTDLLKECTIDEIKAIAAESMSAKLEDVTIEAHNDSLYVISAKKKNCNEIRIVDSKGFIKIQRRDGICLISTAGKVYEDMKKIWEQGSLYKSDLMLVPDMYVVLGARVLDLSGISYFEQIEKVLSTEIADYDDNKQLIIVGGKNDM